MVDDYLIPLKTRVVWDPVWGCPLSVLSNAGLGLCCSWGRSPSGLTPHERMDCRPQGVGHGLTLLAAGRRGGNLWAVGPDWEQTRSYQWQQYKYVFTITDQRAMGQGLVGVRLHFFMHGLLDGGHPLVDSLSLFFTQPMKFRALENDWRESPLHGCFCGSQMI